MKFTCDIFCFSIPNRYYTSINFLIVDDSKPKLCLFLYIFIIKAWSSLLDHYLGLLTLPIVILLRYIESLGYKRLNAQILSSNLHSELFDPKKINDKLSNKLIARHISQVFASLLFVCSPLGLAFKNDSGFQKIH